LLKTDWTQPKNVFSFIVFTFPKMAANEEKFSGKKLKGTKTKESGGKF
jgi:hypothetical protein